jgi:enediyne biosynthesis protein E4
MKPVFACLYLSLFLAGCTKERERPEKPAFEQVDAGHSGIHFINALAYTERLNTYTYRNFYNGAGVALGDINNDGLLDIYLSGNLVDNKLYLNQGNFKFQDITENAGVACRDVWSTGVTMADVNGDGLTDIFVCKSGPPLGGRRKNELFINNGNLTFTESAEAWGVADEGLSIHTAFFDYDKDGDLDFYLLNNSNRSVGIYDLKKGQREVRDPFGGNRLYRNEGDHFTDVSEKAGIFGSAIGFGLGVTVSDVNKDGWQDIFVSNDFFEKDYLYLNQQNGTFREALEEYMTEISMGSMGADIADINNDGYPEIYVTEMLPETLERVKTKTIFEDWNKYNENVKNGYYHQFTRNVLQLNNGPVPGDEQNCFFSEIGRFAGVHATDWSWGALIFDYNNDGLKDLFVANGIAKDLTDQDYINYYANAALTSSNLRQDSLLLTRLIDKIPSTPLLNYLFHNDGELRFHNTAVEQGLNMKGFSNGAAYGDLNNDGALDLVVSNINETVSVYRNTTVPDEDHNYIQIAIQGAGKNTFAFGAQVTLYCGADIYYAEQGPTKGYLSSVDPRIHLGIGKHKTIDSMRILWTDLSSSVLRNVSANQVLKIKQSEIPGTTPAAEKKDPGYYFSLDETMMPEYIHTASGFIDFNRDKLLFEMITGEGQRISKADVDGDGLEDIFIGGAANQEGSLWLQKPGGKFSLVANNNFTTDKRCEDTAAIFFDADGDKDPDLYVCSGGNQFSYGSPELKDRLYFNDGKGNFSKADQIVKQGDKRESSAFVINMDFNKDGHQDLVVGSRVIPFYYGVPANTFLLQNDGTGKFNDVTSQYAPGFLKLGLSKDAAAFDHDQDGDLDVVICGEWMDIKVFENRDGTFADVTEGLGLQNTSGLWNTISTADINHDGFPDLVAGNNGLNSRYSASADNPLLMYIGDLDYNGSADQILCQSVGGKAYPLVMLQDLTKQIPALRKKFPTFDQYKDKAITDIIDAATLNKAIVLKATQLETAVFVNGAGKGFSKVPLPKEAQFTKMCSIAVMDVNNDGHPDLVMAGNHRKIKPELGLQDAGYGTVLTGNGKGQFTHVNAERSGIFVRGEVRDIENVRIGDSDYLLFLRNNDKLKVFKHNKQ